MSNEFKDVKSRLCLNPQKDTPNEKIDCGE